MPNLAVGGNAEAPSAEGFFARYLTAVKQMVLVSFGCDLACSSSRGAFGLDTDLEHREAAFTERTFCTWISSMDNLAVGGNVEASPADRFFE